MIGLIVGAFKVLVGSYNKRVDQATQLKLAVIDVDKQDMNNRAAVIKRSMSAKTFWVAWGLFAFPLGAWWLLVMLDTATPSGFLNLGIPDLPETIRPYADMIFNSIFYSGGGVATAQSVGRGVLSYMSGRKS